MGPVTLHSEREFTAQCHAYSHKKKFLIMKLKNVLRAPMKN